MGGKDSGARMGATASRRPGLAGWAASAATFGVIVASACLPRGASPVLRAAGVFALAWAAAFIFPPFFLLSRYGRTERGGSYMDTTSVVDRGTYALVRHPQYLGYMLLGGGFALLSQHPITLGLAVLGVALFHRQAVQEEAGCLQRLGEEYARYAEVVPRFNVLLGIVRWARRHR